MKKMLANRTAQRRAYTAPEAIEVSATADLVQGGGGGSGLDWMHFYYYDQYGR